GAFRRALQAQEHHRTSSVACGRGSGLRVGEAFCLEHEAPDTTGEAFNLKAEAGEPDASSFLLCGALPGLRAAVPGCRLRPYPGFPARGQRPGSAAGTPHSGDLSNPPVQMTPTPRPLVLALAFGLSALVAAPHADAQRKRAKAPVVPAQCTDFHAQANAAWLAANPLPAGTDSISVLGQLAERARGQQRALLDAAMQSPQNEVQKRLGDFWASGLDEAAVEADGSKPIAPLLSRIDAIKRARD